eukprot:6470012-Amphidinium_carterae.1
MLMPRCIANDGMVAFAPCVRSPMAKSWENPCWTRMALRWAMSLASTGGLDAQASAEVAALPKWSAVSQSVE